MGNIVLLDELTINQIAAGEVIERPASVVKELVENSIDAGATKITVEVEGGGIKKIRIIDNGSGIKDDDLDYAFERHATSKIRTAGDLEQVKSMGFRGEALASIAAIANIEMITKTADKETGNKIIVEAGKILEKEETGCQTGTSITITKLFFNTPVRYKFLKKDYTELGYIEDAVTKIALANPSISIKLLNEKKTIIQTTGDGSLKNVIYNIYGKDMAEGMVDVDYNYEDIKITGAVGKPEIARNNRTYQIFFVNKRNIKDKTLSAAMEQGFKGLLQIGKYGVAVINLEIEPRKIDVNVHPTKLEIRFEEEQKVFKAVYHAIKESLLKNELVTDVKENNEGIKNIHEDEFVKEDVLEKKDEEPVTHKIGGLFNMFKKTDIEKKEEEKEYIPPMQDNMLEQIYMSKNDNVVLENDVKEIASTDTIEEDKFNQMYNKTFGIEDKNPIDNVPKVEVKPVSLFEESEKYSVPTYKYIGSLFSTYIVIEMGQEIYIIDQHAAHERVMYEQVKKNFYDNKEKDSQIMLLPDIINLSHKEKNIVKENVELFNKAGFTFEEFGENTIRLIGVPNICMELDTKELFIEILDEINTVAITAKQEKEEKFIATIACKAAVKAKMKLDEAEVDSLMQQLLKLQNPFTCPHGRPTAIKMSKTEIEKKFGRK
ncbi:MAG: DNA mismatch repair endonuclease MutL [Clostridia bacterium]|nr:DNA mismatch repair endonuclease MutL [Clostridia bacterium]